MKTIQGPGLFLAQFAGEQAPFDDWRAITRWAAGCGYAGVQVPSGTASRGCLFHTAAQQHLHGEKEDSLA